VWIAVAVRKATEAALLERSPRNGPCYLPAGAADDALALALVEDEVPEPDSVVWLAVFCGTPVTSTAS
jgi:hypothetical protein